MPHDPAVETRTRDLIASLARLPRLADADASQQAEIASLFASPRTIAPPSPPALSPRATRVRVVHWNIEHGNRFARVRDALRTHPALRDHDVICLNEVDWGMARSGNHDIAGELADALGLHAAWTPMFLEMGPGRHDDVRLAAGRPNREGLLGVALLSRWPLADVRAVGLPVAHLVEFGFQELRMVGRHVALLARVEHPVAPFHLATAHLTVHGRPEDRRAQMATLLAALPPDNRPAILTGDFNSHTYDRMTLADSVRGFLTLLKPAGALRARLLSPDLPALAPREPLFAELARAGFEWRAYGDREPTLRLRYDRLPELDILPLPLRDVALRLLTTLSRRGMLRLDWIAARGCGGGTGQTISGLDEEPQYAADHRPVVAEIALRGACERAEAAVASG